MEVQESRRLELKCGDKRMEQYNCPQWKTESEELENIEEMLEYIVGREISIGTKTALGEWDIYPKDEHCKIGALRRISDTTTEEKTICNGIGEECYDCTDYWDDKCHKGPYIERKHIVAYRADIKKA